MALSDKLTDLASRIKELEDAAAATKAKNRAKLEQQREQLNSKMKTQAQSIQSSGHIHRSPTFATVRLRSF